jgi:tRNA threonylcarbamoyladenosine biosynthesis protein TsaE
MTREEGVFRSVTIADLEVVAQAIIERLNTVKVWLFKGEMGSGKTTLIKVICEALGVRKGMSSPTFSIVNEYETDDGKLLYHFDFYRIKNEAEAIDIGTEEYFYSGHPCFIEWPDRVVSLIPFPNAEVTINIETNTQRIIALAVHDGKKENRI